jgi:elongation factor P
MISSNELRPGTTIEYRDSVWQVVEAMHVKPGKGAAFVQTRLRNLETDCVLSVKFRAGERLSAANIERDKFTFVYRDGHNYILMNAAGDKSIELQSVHFGQNLDLLKEGQDDITVTTRGGEILRVDLPNTVELQVCDTAPDERGNTATLETGATITVPFHVQNGDKVRIGTRTRKYTT